MLDDIVFGNPSKKYVSFLEKACTYDKHIPTLIKFGFPQNSSKATREELNTIVDYIADLEANQEHLARYKNYDHSLERVLADIISQNQFDDKIIDVIDSLLDDSYSLICKLKFHFQRARPYQLGEAYKLKLFPFDSYSSNSPSYPSGHTLQVHLIKYVVGNLIPEKYEYLEKFASDVEYSRLYMGLNYQSDNDFALFCVETITKDKEFKQKYGL
jgi:hypothetical protein